jgi:hypothetical protein
VLGHPKSITQSACTATTHCTLSVRNKGVTGMACSKVISEFRWRDWNKSRKPSTWMAYPREFLLCYIQSFQKNFGRVSWNKSRPFPQTPCLFIILNNHFVLYFAPHNTTAVHKMSQHYRFVTETFVPPGLIKQQLLKSIVQLFPSTPPHPSQHVIILPREDMWHTQISHSFQCSTSKYLCESCKSLK